MTPLPEPVRIEDALIWAVIICVFVLLLAALTPLVEWWGRRR